MWEVHPNAFETKRRRRDKHFGARHYTFGDFCFSLLWKQLPWIQNWATVTSCSRDSHTFLRILNNQHPVDELIGWKGSPLSNVKSLNKLPASWGQDHCFCQFLTKYTHPKWLKAIGAGEKFFSLPFFLNSFQTVSTVNWITRRILY